MLCQRCQVAWLGPDGRCPGCDDDPWKTPAPQQQPPQQQAYQSPYQQPPHPQQPPQQGYAYPAPAYPAPGYPAAGYPPPAPAPAPAPVRVPGALSTALYVLLGLSVIADLLSLVAGALEFSLFGRLESDPGGVDISEADAVDAFYAITAVGGWLLLIGTGVVFIVWFYRVRVNAEAIGPAWRQRFGRGMAIGAWFIPIANLWLPKQIADDIWNASDSNARPGDPYTGAGRLGTAGLVLCWWLAWMGTNIVSYLAVFMDRTTEVFDYSGMQGVYGVEMTSSLLSVTAGVLAILVVRKITTMQGVRHAMGGAPGGQVPGQGAGPGWGYPR